MKRGSALLIVLGMLSFMVVSAVGFAAYMRYSRLPSSFLRRSASSRQLVKAALAEAIDEIDSMIGEDPYPDIRLNATKQKGPAKGSENRNTWAGNVYIGTHALQNASAQNYTYPSSESTVSTLTLEGLAYIPPSLVNEARYYSRHSAAGQWHDMAYDVGRYAFCAINVSDCFDINAIKADRSRSSGDNRVSLAHLFEDAPAHTSSGSAKEWDDFIDSCHDQKMPLVSLADWNLAIANGDKSGGNVAGISAPFVKWLKSNGQGFLEANDIEKVRLMPFITDGWFPTATANGTLTVDISKEDEQPFTVNGYSDNATVMSLVQATVATPKWKSQLFRATGNGCLTGLDAAALYDYLDENDVPVNLAIPTVERVPMVCAYQFNGGSAPTMQLSVSKTPKDLGLQPNQTAPTSYDEEYVYKFDAAGITKLFAQGQLKALLLYPFRRGKERNESGLKTDAVIKMFFAPPGLKIREASAFIHPAASDFTSGGTRYQNGVFTVYCPGNGNLNVPSEVLKAEQSVIEATYNMKDGVNFAAALNQPLFAYTLKWGVIKDPNTGNWIKDTSSTPTVAPGTFVQNIQHLDATYSAAAPILRDTDFAQMHAGGAPVGTDVTLYVCVWFRVLCPDGDVVDLAPAAVDDDSIIAGRTGSGISNPRQAAQVFGAATPLLRMDGSFGSDNKFHWGTDIDTSLSQAGGTFTFANYQMMCPDPRYNHAPEDWFNWSGGFNASGWLGDCGVNADGRDRDIFMFTSDQGWLQSPYELAFLPRNSNLVNDGDSISGNYDVPNGGNSTGYAAALANCQHNGLFWRTYRCYDYKNSGNGNYVADNFGNLKIVRSAGGVRINPYTQQTNVMMAAFANTPYDWWAASPYNADISLNDASTSSIDPAKQGWMEAKKFNSKYAFNAIGNSQGSGRYFSWEDLQDVCAEFMYQFSRDRKEDWCDVYDLDLDWHGEIDNTKKFCNVELIDSDELSECDRKFLFGYWRECFANRQQLFLVFVRAEPALMGAGTAGAIPPALGGRAVALVWRNPVAGKIVADGEDPVEPSDEYAPHRTRILFYRQLD